MRQGPRIIVEGMDGSGKTTLVDALMMHVPNLEVIRNELGPEQDLDKWWPEQLERPASDIVPLHDRFFYSELVYGPILRKRIKAEPTLVQNVLWFLRTQALLIYCRPHSDRLIEGFAVADQLEGVAENFGKILHLYDELMSAEKSWYGSKRFVQYVWDREGEYERVEAIVKSYIAGELRD